MKPKVHCRVHNSPPPVPTLSPVPLLEDPFKYYPPHYADVFEVVSFPQISSTKPCMYIQDGLVFNKIFFSDKWEISSVLVSKECPRLWLDFRER
jgi:hypothetical protein